MSFLSTLRWKLFGVRDQVIDRTEETLRLSAETRHTTKLVNEMLKSYAAQDRPFMAMLIDRSNAEAMKAQLAQWNDKSQ